MVTPAQVPPSFAVLPHVLASKWDRVWIFTFFPHASVRQFACSQPYQCIWRREERGREGKRRRKRKRKEDGDISDLFLSCLLLFNFSWKLSWASCRLLIDFLCFSLSWHEAKHDGRSTTVRKREAKKTSKARLTEADVEFSSTSQFLFLHFPHSQ